MNQQQQNNSFDNCSSTTYVSDFTVSVDDEVLIRDDGGADPGDVLGSSSGTVP